MDNLPFPFKNKYFLKPFVKKQFTKLRIQMELTINLPKFREINIPLKKIEDIAMKV